MTTEKIRETIEEATLEFTLGNDQLAADRLLALLQDHPESYGAHLALTEIRLAQGLLESALGSAQSALALNPEDIHIHTSLSRIYVELGDKEKAEHHGNQARMLGWKEQLKEPPPQ
jgi:Flp pilus assembly protein TadD